MTTKYLWFSVACMTAVMTAGGAQVHGGQQRDDLSADALLGAALHQEEVEGDLDAAIGTYQELLARPGISPALAANALVRMAACYETLGRPKARDVYERLVRDYPNQREQVVTAQARLAAFTARSAESQLPAGVTIRKLDFGAGSNGGVTPWNVSQDGRYLGATEYGTGNAAIVDLRSGEHRNVTDYGNWDHENGYIDVSAISRDGQRIAFWHYKYRATEGNLRVVNADGTGERVLLMGQDFDRGWGVPTDWSPDGRYVVAQLAARTDEGPDVIDFALVPVDGGEVRIVKTLPLTARHRSKLVFSPDGRYLAYDFPPQAGARQTDLYVLPVTGGQETAVATHPARDTFVGWTPNGDLLFLSDRTGTIDLYRIAMDNGRQSGEPERLQDGTGDIHSFGVSASGAFYYSEMREEWNAYFASIDFATGSFTSQPVKVTDRFQDSVSMPAWSDDGRYFSYVRHHAGGAAPTVIIRDIGSGDERELLPAMTLDGQGAKVRWHPDGRSLLAVGTQDDQRGLFRISVDTGAAALVDGTAGLAVWDWSPDATWLFYSGGEGGHSMFRRNLETGDEQTTYVGESRTRTYRVSPDGSRIAFVEHPAEPDDAVTLRVIPTDSGPSREIVSRRVQTGAFSFSSLNTAWSKDSRDILFVSDEVGGGSALWVVPAEGGEARRTELVLSQRIGEVSLDPDSERLVYSTGSRRTEFWVMENFLPAQ